MESVQKQIAKYIDNKGITIMHISQKKGKLKLWKTRKLFLKYR